MALSKELKIIALTITNSVMMVFTVSAKFPTNKGNGTVGDESSN